MTPTSMTPNHTILKVMDPIPRHLRTLQTMLRLISPWSMQSLTNVPVSCPNPNPSVLPCQMAKLWHALASAEKLIDLTGIPKECHDFADVFSEVKANKLPPHRPYNLKINIEEGSTPPLGLIYSLSKTELEALREFLDENIANGFIRPICSPYGASILFVKKKGGTLRLCVDFRGLNKLTKKDRYPIPLTSDLLDSPKNARIYTKIDLRHAY